MFTGLIEVVGSVESIRAGSKGLRIAIRSPAVASGLAIGDSVNVDGVCQTVIAADASSFTVEAVGDTLEKTTFRRLKQGGKVNLERALRADGRLGGHMVMGHVTGAARVDSWGPEAGRSSQGAGAWFLVLDLDPSWADRVAPEGSIAVDGISLTVAEVTHDSAVGASGLLARISIIPHTRLATTLALKREGDFVNIELDILASYVRAAMSVVFGKGRAITPEALRSWGY
ncbi:MAG: riboflavin synthase [Spirochaetia bacterium]|jgi:riboflavin synthase